MTSIRLNKTSPSSISSFTSPCFISNEIVLYRHFFLSSGFWCSAEGNSTKDTGITFFLTLPSLHFKTLLMIFPSNLTRCPLFVLKIEDSSSLISCTAREEQTNKMQSQPSRSFSSSDAPRTSTKSTIHIQPSELYSKTVRSFSQFFSWSSVKSRKAVLTEDILAAILKQKLIIDGKSRLLS